MLTHLWRQNRLTAHLAREQRTRGRFGGHGTGLNDLHGAPPDGHAYRCAPLGTWQLCKTRTPPGHRCSTYSRLCTPEASIPDRSRRRPLPASRTAPSWLIPSPWVTRPVAANAYGVPGACEP